MAALTPAPCRAPRPACLGAALFVLAAALVSVPAHAQWVRAPWGFHPPDERPFARAFLGYGLSLPLGVDGANLDIGWDLSGGVEFPVGEAFSLVGRGAFSHMSGAPVTDYAGHGYEGDVVSLSGAGVGLRFVVQREGLIEYLEGDLGAAWASVGANRDFVPATGVPVRTVERSIRQSFSVIEGLMYQSETSPLGFFAELESRTLLGRGTMGTFPIRIGVTLARDR